MKITITDIRVRIMGVKGRNWVFVFVETDSGITGVGEATTEYHELAVAAMIENHLGPWLRGEDALRIEFLWQRAFRQLWWRGGVVATSALSGIDQALGTSPAKRITFRSFACWEAGCTSECNFTRVAIWD
jgi:L-alanine-DL-glutamate epimerase-like enolase superfamily enzyme